METGPRMYVATVTPALAAQWLLLNTVNRPLSQSRVKQYVADMVNGRWFLDGNPIKFARTEAGLRLLDGQHRLQAVIDAGIAVQFTIVEGIDAEAMTVMDTGMARTPGNALALQGIPNGKVVAGIARLVFAYDNDAIGASQFLSIHFTRSVLVDFVRAHQDEIDEAQKYGERLRHARRHNSPAAGAFYFIGARNEAYRTEFKDFTEQCATLIGLESGNPVLALDKFILRYQGVRIANKSEVEFAARIKAWNAFVFGGRLKLIRKYEAGVPFPRFATDAVEETAL